MKKYITCGVILLCIFILLQFALIPYLVAENGSEFHPFSQDPLNAESVEIYKSHDQWYEKHRIWKIPDEESADILLSQSLNLNNKGKGMLFDPPTNFGLYVIKIVFEDGTIELVGETNRMTISPEGNVTYGYHNFDGTLNHLIEKVLKDVPEFDGNSYLLQDQLQKNKSGYENIDDWMERYQNSTTNSDNNCVK